MTDRVWTINARLPVAIPVRMTANLRDWYDNVRDNPKCVSSVNLNDPFFSHRDIKFIMDLDGKEIFDDTVNYVTVNVRKKRTTGRDFEDHITIDSKYLKDNGVAASVTYARGEDKNPDLYQYQSQWSLKGGNVFPQNPNMAAGQLGRRHAHASSAAREHRSRGRRRRHESQRRGAHCSLRFTTYPIRERNRSQRPRSRPRKTRRRKRFS